MTDVVGYCPACGSQTLFLGDGGHVTCSRLDCPRPTAADELLADDETHHVVQLGPKTFTVRHPLHERLDDALMTCGVHERIAGMDGPPAASGRYRVRVDGELWNWERMPEVTS
mgnify:FL=1